MTRKPNKSVADCELPLFAVLPWRVTVGTALLSDVELGEIDVGDMEIHGRCSSRKEWGYNQR
jgi:hypothetical protein